jgi:hypothetical protein
VNLQERETLNIGCAVFAWAAWFVAGVAVGAAAVGGVFG